MINYTNSALFKKDGIHKQLNIQYSGGTITNSDLHAESFSLEESLCSEQSLRFGCCETSKLQFRVRNPYDSLKGESITVKMIVNKDERNPLQLGEYKVVSDVPSADRSYRDITAYDGMYDILTADVTDWYNEILPKTDSQTTLRQFRKSFINYFGLQEETTTLVNDDMIVTKNIGGDSITGKMVISAICEINGCFGNIARDGKFRYIHLPKPSSSGYKITRDMYRGSPIYEDFTVKTIGKVQIRQEDNDSGIIVGTGDNLYVVQGNFLVYGMELEDVKTVAQNLLTQINYITYTPYSVTAFGNPCVEVGDLVEITTKTATINSYVFSRFINGIQSLSDVYGASGTEYVERNDNSLSAEIIKLKGRTNTLTRTLEETRSEITAVEEKILDLNNKVAGINGIFHIRYSSYSDGRAMTDIPTYNSKYVGVAFAKSGNAPSLYTDYLWYKIGSDTNGYKARGEEQYLHIKYSNDGETFLTESRVHTVDQKGFVLKASGNVAAHTSQNRVVSDPVWVNTGETYSIDASANYGNAMFAAYSDKTVKSIITSTNDETGSMIEGYEYIVPAGINNIRIASNLDIQPYGYKVIKKVVAGEGVGDWIGTYVDDKLADSDDFNAYTWKKYATENEFSELKTLITQTAEEIKLSASKKYQTLDDADAQKKELEASININAKNIELKVSENDINGNYIISKINLDSTTAQIQAKYIKLEGYTTINESFRVLEDGNVEASNIAVENELSVNRLNVKTINNGQYQKTLITSPTIYVNNNNGDDDQECINGAVFKTLQGAINSIPKYMNGRTVNIILQNNTTENVYASYFQSGRIHIYLSGYTLYGYFNSYLSQYIYLYGGTKNGGGIDVKGNVHPSTGVLYSNYTISVLYNNSGGFVRNVNVYGSDSLLTYVNDDGETKTANNLAIHGVNFAHVYLTDISLINTYQGFRANAGAHLHINTSSGVVSDYAFYSTSGSLITLGSLKQAGSSDVNKNTGVSYGGEVRYHNPTFETGSTSSSESKADTTKINKTAPYTSSKGNAIQYYGGSSAEWRSDNTPKVGTWGYGNHVAYWFFSDDFVNISDKEVYQVDITFTRNSGGYSAATPHDFYVHSYESQPSTTSPSKGVKIIDGVSVATNSSKTIKITDSTLIGKIKSAKGICSYPSSQDKDHYSVMSGTMKVKFYYKE